MDLNCPTFTSFLLVSSPQFYHTSNLILSFFPGMIRHYIIGSWNAPSHLILLCKAGYSLINLKLEKNLARDCEFTQKNAWQFRKFLGEYRNRAGHAQGTVLSSHGSLMNRLSHPKRCFSLKSRNIPCLRTLMPEWSSREVDTVPLSLLGWPLSFDFVVTPVFPFNILCNSLHLTSLQITFN